MTATKRKTDNATEPSTVFARQRTPNAKIEQYERWLKVLGRKLKPRSSFEFIYKGDTWGERSERPLWLPLLTRRACLRCISSPF